METTDTQHSLCMVLFLYHRDISIQIFSFKYLFLLEIAFLNAKVNERGLTDPDVDSSRNKITTCYFVKRAKVHCLS